MTKILNIYTVLLFNFINISQDLEIPMLNILTANIIKIVITK